MKKTPIKRKPSTLVRTPIKKKPGSALKRQKLTAKTPSKRKKTTDQAKLKKELWELCKQIIRKRYGNTCYTCGKTGLEGSSWQTGHFVASSICGVYLRWDIRNLRPQCFRCNISLVGNGAVFYRNLVALEGQAYVDTIFADKERLTKLTPEFLREKITEYTIILGTVDNSLPDTTPEV